MSDVPDYQLRAAGAADRACYDRVELSVCPPGIRHRQATARPSSVWASGFAFKQDIVGVKLRVLGDAVYEQDQLGPAGLGRRAVQEEQSGSAVIKRRRRPAMIAGSTTMSPPPSCCWTSSLVLVSGAVRMTKANQTGLLGFGGDRERPLQGLQFEGSAGLHDLSKRLAVGAEYRTKPRQSGLREGGRLPSTCSPPMRSTRPCR